LAKLSGWIIMMATGEAPFYAIAAVMFTSMAFFISVASIHARAAAVFHPTASGGVYVRLQRFLVTTATAASMAAVVDRCLALAHVKTSADARTDV
jgi:hypothetical protein